MNKQRCHWCKEGDQVYQDYHDYEWGIPVHDDHLLYEMFLLETFQAGLSWLTILKKREAFREAFDDFDVKRIACYNEDKCEELYKNKNIIRNHRKIKAAVNNAKIFMSIQKEFDSFDHYIWSFTKGKTIINQDDVLPTSSLLSNQISDDLKKRGMSFVGTITIYSYLEAIGIYNNHELNCFAHKK